MSDKNCDPLVLGPALAIERTPGFIVAKRGIELVGEAIAGAAVPSRSGRPPGP